MFFVLAAHHDEKDCINKQGVAEFQVNVVELLLYIITTLAVIIAMVQLRGLKYDRKMGKMCLLYCKVDEMNKCLLGHEGNMGIGLDNTLLVVAQTGMFIYSMFSIIGCYFTLASNSSVGLAAEIFSFIQTCLQVTKIYRISSFISWRNILF